MLHNKRKGGYLGAACFVGILSFIFPAYYTHADNQPVASGCQKVVFTAHPNYPPFHWADDNHIAGLSADIAARALDSLGVAYESRHLGPWPRVLFNAQQGNIDLVLRLKRTPEREQYLHFTTTPILDNPFSIFVAKGKEFEFTHWNELVDKVGNLNRGDRFGDPFDTFIAERLQTQRVKGLSENFQMLLLNRADYFITGKNTGLAYLKASGMATKFSVLPKPVVKGKIDFGFVSTSPCVALLEDFDRELAKQLEKNDVDDYFTKNWDLWLATRPVLTTQED